MQLWLCQTQGKEADDNVTGYSWPQCPQSTTLADGTLLVEDVSDGLALLSKG